MKIKLLIICLCLAGAAVGGKMSVDFTSAKQISKEKSHHIESTENNIELTKASESTNEK